ncbi:hypothetical protein RB614_34280 [Phytohabitans sp. ZYX-F-186]|uniref:Uncharacterized protein n=1 Tax=Phytohabitans maris TaxID=3071409 RepID=A0ABU0ZRE6_9ACTN|nr:hypothetical protein [Phytohabitans sp. ZYX-F-186]MDQ7909600.1 hypothetical protein [Phytohabitans sp. ZYX-F-186]
MLVFAGIPLAIVLVISGLAALGGGRAAKRYRPGRPFDFAPVWFLAAPEQLVGAETAGAEAAHAELPAGTPSPAALPAGPSVAKGELVAAPTRVGPTGGASDRW